MAHGRGNGLLLCTAGDTEAEVSALELGEWCGRSKPQMVFPRVCKAGRAEHLRRPGPGAAQPQGGQPGRRGRLALPAGDPAYLLVAFSPLDTLKHLPFRVLVTALIVLGMAGLGMALLTVRRLGQTLAVLTGGYPTPAQSSTHGDGVAPEADLITAR